ncbi:MAG: ATP-binding cassette domain-containing protein [Anaerolineae bacterium]|jgi:oligopeptide transport system ATP-binding protein|nr:ATP-binding cassette domain-containing protein [Anaerolineae bacterium]MBT3714692.1 ATP-binding cassette domain-containing protein [Anaerolineae bacterium]MBT4310136.1 ATP-binding cassette domain-containing protein [Anaerolineae bacterium]MBT4457926.1 ATP-binding cassette domain-containing protein [Anaerolineae bacterium]MBT4843409.1 ATP-binding cassette domain-containing protein [Anaerolineae bacterium]
MSENNILVQVENLKKHFPIIGGMMGRQIGAVKAVDGISFDIQESETLGMVGESGCGKSTAGRAILQLHKPTAGQVFFKDQDLTQMSGEDVRQLRPKIQMIFQDPYATLNPRHSVRKIIGEPLIIHGMMKKGSPELKDRVAELLELVGMDPAYMRRFPHEFSGGQRQRIGIARALSLNPDFIVCDEPISALDVSIQAQVVNLMQDLQDQLGIAYLFIAHDLSMVKHISHRIAVMYLGKIMELTERNTLFDNPLHPYTQSLNSAVPIPDPKLEQNRKRFILKGDPPSPANPPSGCVFHTRCPLTVKKCIKVKPEFREMHPGHFVACHLADEKGGSKISKQTILASEMS